MSNNSKQKTGNIGSPSPEQQSELEACLDAMITRRIIMFHDALIARGQIEPIPTNAREPVELDTDAKAA